LIIATLVLKLGIVIEVLNCLVFNLTTNARTFSQSKNPNTMPAVFQGLKTSFGVNPLSGNAP
jgi:hypothetical protein